MIIRITEKLGKKIKVKPVETLPQAENAFADWSANLFTIRGVQYIIASNTATLYSVVCLGRGITSTREFEAAICSAIQRLMAEDGLGGAWNERILTETKSFVYSKALNREVTGSMNDLIKRAKFYISEQGITLVSDVSRKLNNMPLSYVKYANPGMLFKEIAMEL